MTSRDERERRTLSLGAIHLPGWLDTPQQQRLVEAFREWSTGPVPIRAASLPGGTTLSSRTQERHNMSVEENKEIVGTQTGAAFDDMPVGALPAATGKTMRFTGTTILKLENGLITEEIGLDDGVTVLQQLGLIPSA
jgi:hypothetical protein